jgi:hypothetical protein
MTINNEDLIIERFRLPNQGINESGRAVKIIHKPSGKFVVCDDDIKYCSNYKNAYTELKDRITAKRIYTIGDDNKIINYKFEKWDDDKQCWMPDSEEAEKWNINFKGDI